MKIKDIKGDVFGRLTAVKYVRMVPRVGQVWLMRCACGNEEERKLRDLKYSGKRGMSPKCKKCRDITAVREMKRALNRNAKAKRLFT